MKNLVLSLFLVFSFAVQGFGDDNEIFMALQKTKKCSDILTNLMHEGDAKLDEYDKCFNDLSKKCFKYDSCSDCLASIIMNIDLKSMIPTYSSKFEENIQSIIREKSDVCPSLKENTTEVFMLLGGKK